MPGFKPVLAIPKEKTIQHFTIAEWVDFSRGLLNGTRSANMRKHADTCGTCRELADYCSKLARLCQGIPSSEAPDDVVRRAYAIFPHRETHPAAAPPEPESLIIQKD